MGYRADWQGYPDNYHKGFDSPTVAAPDTVVLRPVSNVSFLPSMAHETQQLQIFWDPGTDVDGDNDYAVQIEVNEAPVNGDHVASDTNAVWINISARFTLGTDVQVRVRRYLDETHQSVWAYSDIRTVVKLDALDVTEPEYLIDMYGATVTLQWAAEDDDNAIVKITTQIGEDAPIVSFANNSLVYGNEPVGIDTSDPSVVYNWIICRYNNFDIQSDDLVYSPFTVGPMPPDFDSSSNFNLPGYTALGVLGNANHDGYLIEISKDNSSWTIAGAYYDSPSDTNSASSADIYGQEDGSLTYYYRLSSTTDDGATFGHYGFVPMMAAPNFHSQTWNGPNLNESVTLTGAISATAICYGHGADCIGIHAGGSGEAWVASLPAFDLTVAIDDGVVAINSSIVFDTDQTYCQANGTTDSSGASGGTGDFGFSGQSGGDLGSGAGCGGTAGTSFADWGDAYPVPGGLGYIADSPLPPGGDGGYGADDGTSPTDGGYPGGGAGFGTGGSVPGVGGVGSITIQWYA